MPSNGHVPKRAWVTLLTRPSYLPGVITLAYSLSLHATAYPLVVLVTPSLPQTCIRALELESSDNSLLIIHSIEPLMLPDDRKTTLIAARFEDTWTKLRAFELTSYDACVFLDADITIYKNMDDLFDDVLPGDDWIAANHACVCNLDQDSWAPENWKPENCPYTPLQHPAACERASPIPPGTAPPHTYALLNGGVFLYHPSESLWKAMHHHFLTSPELSTFQFPDQDFLASFFCGRWRPLPWKYNALKTMRQWHTNIWRDEEVKGLHYIVDKPWEKRVASDGIAGHLGRDGETHTWWWNVWDEWRSQSGSDNKADKMQCEENKNKRFPIPIPSGSEAD
ncbi:nucleotide-diphospho-sugar transferase [Usnea florida]